MTSWFVTPPVPPLANSGSAVGQQAWVVIRSTYLIVPAQRPQSAIRSFLSNSSSSLLSSHLTLTIDRWPAPLHRATWNFRSKAATATPINEEIPDNSRCFNVTFLTSNHAKIIFFTNTGLMHKWTTEHKIFKCQMSMFNIFIFCSLKNVQLISCQSCKDCWMISFSLFTVSICVQIATLIPKTTELAGLAVLRA